MPTNSGTNIHREVSAKLSSLIEQTLSHWKIANSKLPSKFPVVLFSDTTLEAAEALVGTLMPLHEQAVELEVDADLVTGALREKHAALREWLQFYSRMVRGNAPGTKWERLLEPLPHVQSAPLLMLKAAQAVAYFWAELEQAPPRGWPGPMVRMDGSGLAEFRAEVRAFADAMADDMDARIAAEIAQGFVAWTRDQLGEICLRYPGAVKSRFRAGSGLLDSVPKPWPQSAGSK